VAILVRFVDLEVVSDMVYNEKAQYEAYRSDPTMKTFLLTARYLPLPHPTSAPIAPSGCSVRKRSTMGHG
jgi:hypothetical protein